MHHFLRMCFLVKRNLVLKNVCLRLWGENSQRKEENIDVEPRREKMARTSKSFGPEFLTYLLESEPQSYNEAIRSPEGQLWK